MARRPREEPGVRYVQTGQERTRGQKSLLGLGNNQKRLPRETFRTAPDFFHSEESSMFFEMASMVSSHSAV